jgi:hypothetical protein
MASIGRMGLPLLRNHRRDSGTPSWRTFYRSFISGNSGASASTTLCALPDFTSLSMASPTESLGACGSSLVSSQTTQSRRSREAVHSSSEPSPLGNRAARFPLPSTKKQVISINFLPRRDPFWTAQVGAFIVRRRACSTVPDNLCRFAAHTRS